MKAFQKLHPVLRLVFYLSVFLLTFTVHHPLFAAVSLVGAWLYTLVLQGKRALNSLGFICVVLAVVSALNLLFAHYGTDVLFTVKDTAFTLEALVYGFYQGLVLCAVWLWFAALSTTTDSSRVAYILRYTPKLALLFSMVLGFLPRFRQKLHAMREAQTALNGGKEDKSLRGALRTLSALVTYSLESSIVTADAMKARGYQPKAISTAQYPFETREVCLSVLTVGAAAVVTLAALTDRIVFLFDPIVQNTACYLPALLCYALLSLLPFFLEFYEEILWKVSVLKS